MQLHENKPVLYKSSKFSNAFSETKRGVYLLPNILTTAALFSGFYAVISAIQLQMEAAAVAIFVAMLLDSLDGRVARLMQAETLFGAQYDSLSDLINFGLAPALLAYQAGLNQLGRFGWVLAFAYTAATALRLARFNIQKSKQDYRYFVGLPCPAAAGCVAGLIWLGTDWDLIGTAVMWKLSLVSVLLLASYAMVSPIRYYAFKDLTVKRKMPHITVLLIVGLFGSIAYDPPTVLFTIFCGYLISGIFFWSKKYLMRYVTVTAP